MWRRSTFGWAAHPYPECYRRVRCSHASPSPWRRWHSPPGRPRHTGKAGKEAKPRRKAPPAQIGAGAGVSSCLSRLGPCQSKPVPAVRRWISFRGANSLGDGPYAIASGGLLRTRLRGTGPCSITNLSRKGGGGHAAWKIDGSAPVKYWDGRVWPGLLPFPASNRHQ